MAGWLKPQQLLLIRMTREKLHSDPCQLTLEVSQEADHLGQRAITTRGEKCTNSAEYKTDISAVLMDMSDLDPFRDRWFYGWFGI